MKRILLLIVAVLLSNLSFGETNGTRDSSENTKAEALKKKLGNAVMDGVITPQEYGSYINQIHSIKETHQHMQSEASDTKYKASPIKTSHPTLTWEVVGISWTGDVFERIDKLYTPEGWMVKITTINNSVYHGGEAVKYMYVPDTKHKWQPSTEPSLFRKLSS